MRDNSQGCLHDLHRARLPQHPCGIACTVSLRCLTQSACPCRSIVQFQYGDDGLDIPQSSFVKEFGFLARNAARFAQTLDLPEAEAASHTARLSAVEAEAARLKRCDRPSLRMRLACVAEHAAGLREV